MPDRRPGRMADSRPGCCLPKVLMNPARRVRALSRVIATLSLLVLAGASVRAADDTAASPQVCPGETAMVTGAEAASDLADICAGVQSALGFLAVHGLRPTEPVAIEVTARMPEEAGPTAAGCYIEQKRRVYLVPYAVFRRNKTWFGVTITREIYRTLAAHEAAHAVAACHFRVPRPTIQAKEYIAYVAMFSSMSAELRAQALRATPTEGFDSLDRFTPLLYMFDPMRFGAEAYRHFSGAAAPTALLQDILAGRALTD